MAKQAPGWLRPLVDYGPLAAFLIAYWLGDLMTATLAIMASTAVVLAISFAVERRIALMPLITAVVVGVFGGLTIALQDERFIKMKPTIVQAIFGTILLGGLAFGRPLLKPLMSSAWQMEDRGWQLLTFRFGLFFFVMAGLNELVWRTQTDTFWVNFKVFGIMGLTLVFALAQAPLMKRHHIPEPSSGSCE